MSDVMDYLYGPLSKDYCIYFYILSILGFVLLILFLVPAIFMGIMKRKGVDYYFTILGVSFGYAIFYFQNRLLHSMCMGTM